MSLIEVELNITYYRKLRLGQFGSVYFLGIGAHAQSGHSGIVWIVAYGIV